MTSAIQRSIFDTTLDLARLDRRLAEIKASIALPPDLSEMEEDHIPYDVSAHLAGVLGSVRDDFSEAIARLMRASETTSAALRAEHLKRKAN